MRCKRICVEFGKGVIETESNLNCDLILRAQTTHRNLARPDHAAAGRSLAPTPALGLDSLLGPEGLTDCTPN